MSLEMSRSSGVCITQFPSFTPVASPPSSLVWKHEELKTESEAQILGSGRCRKQLWPKVIQTKTKQEDRVRQVSDACHLPGPMSVLVFPVGSPPLTQRRVGGGRSIK